MIQNRYLVVQPIGKGGMGEVYLAVDQRLGSAVALKRTFFNEDEALGNAFEREARILARLRHPVLPKVIDHFIENNDQFLVMEHISGDDLAKRLETANKPFPLSWVMFWADQMLDALNYLHSHEPPIVHRDIKPQNLKLTDENHIVLLDFGLSKDFDTSSAGALNSASVAGYSPHFASMEQIRGTGTDARSDLYSLSATLYQLMANQSPVDALSRADDLLGGKTDPIIPLNDLNPEISPAISDVILKGVAIRQDGRFSTAAEMQKALRRAFNQGKAASAVETEQYVGGDLPLDTSPPEPEPSEMVTRVRKETTDDGPAPTLKLSTPPGTVAADENASTEQYSMAEVDPRDLKIEPGQRSEIAAAAAVAAASAGSAPVEEQTPPSYTPVPPAPQQPKPAAKKSSKAGLIIGVLVGLLLLAAAAAGGGWYAYNNYYLSAAAEPTPTPAPVVSPTPTPQPALADVSLEGNANVATPSPEPNIADNNPTQPPDGPAAKPTPAVVVKTAPVRPVAPPPVKATPKPKGDDRTKIEQ